MRDPTLPNHRRFSSGADVAHVADRLAWKFDAAVPFAGHFAHRTAYVGHTDRGRAFEAFFALYRTGRIFGTGLPLHRDAVSLETGRPLGDGEVRLMD
jgi:hypothetical protein